MRLKKKGKPYKLPTEMREPLTDPGQSTGLIHGEIKIGKTTFIGQLPECFILATEPGTKGLRVFDEQVGTWGKMRRIVKALEEEPSRFRTVAIDTADEAYKQCLEYVCDNLGIDYPGKDAGGKEDYGRSWNAVRREFTSVVNRIVRTGRGVWFTSHSIVETIEPLSGASFDRIVPSMGKQARETINALVDMVFYACFVREVETGRSIRVLFCEGNETVVAGHRETPGAFPPFLPLLREGMWRVLTQAFNGEHPGIDPDSIMIGRTTPAPAQSVLRDAKRGAKGEARRKEVRRR